MTFEITTDHVALKQALISLVGFATGIEPGQPQIDTVTIDAAEAGVQYDITLEVRDINDVVLATHTVSFVASGAPTIAEIRDGLIAAAVADADFSAVAGAVSNSTDKIDLVAEILGDRLNTTVADDGTGTAISETTTAAAVDGRVLWGQQDEERLGNETDFDAFAQLIPTSDGLSFGIDETKTEFIPAEDRQELRTEGLRQMSLSVEVFTRRTADLATKDAHDRVRDLTAVYQAPQGIDIMNSGRASINDHRAQRDLSSLLGEQWEARAQLDLVVLYVVGTLDTDADFIEATTPITEADGTLIVNI